MRKTFKLIVLLLIYAVLSNLIIYHAAAQIDMSKFPIIEKQNVLSQAGVNGVAMLAEFDGAPGEIYVARTTTTQTSMGSGVPYIPSTVARVTDPDGNLAAVCDFSDLTDGKKEIVINIPNGKAGIWSIQMINGCTGDTFEIGIRDCAYWGVRGEKTMSPWSLRYKKGYIYSQSKAEYAYITSTTAEPIKLCTKEGNVIAQTSEMTGYYPFGKYVLKTKNILANTVYMVDYSSMVSGYAMIDGLTGLICPTPEAAERLKGGWIETDNGILTQGSLQAQARAELVRLVSNKNLTLNINKPSTLNPNIKNPIANAQLFGAYAPISSLANTVENQIVSISSPYLGRVCTESELTNGLPSLDFQSCYFESPAALNHANAAAAMAAAGTINLELNYALGNEAIITRSAMGLLYLLVQMGEGGYLRDFTLEQCSGYPVTSGEFVLSAWFKAYEQISGKVDTQTQHVLNEGALALIDKQGNYRGQGATNQMMFHISDNVRMYKITGNERYHEAFKRQITSIMENTAPHLGFNETGYFIENGGCDGSYSYMNENLFFECYRIYRKILNADTVIVAKMEEVMNKAMEFESFFWAEQPKNLEFVGTGYTTVVIPPNCFTPRTDSTFGIASDPAYETIMHLNPLARRRYLMERTSAKYPLGFSSTYPQVINNEGWAWRHINKYYQGYENYMPTQLGMSWPLDTFEAFNHNGAYPAPSRLPSESKDGTIWEKPGFIAFKHKGIYGLCNYQFTAGSSSSVSMSYTGGGPMQFWSSGTGTTLSSQKHLNPKTYERTTLMTNANDVVSTCIMGKLADGSLLVSGREGNVVLTKNKNTFKWLENNKKFQIEGKIPDTDKIAIWTYDLINDGVEITAQISPVLANEEFWLNLPIAVAGTTLNSGNLLNGELSVSYKGSSMIYSWDKNCEVQLLSNLSKRMTDIARLRIKIPQSGQVSFRIKATMETLNAKNIIAYEGVMETDIITADNLQKSITVDVENYTGQTENAIFILGLYDENGQLKDIVMTEKSIQAWETYTLKNDITLNQNSGVKKIKAILLDTLDNLQPQSTCKEYIVK